MDPYKKETREYYKAIGEAPRYQDLRKIARARREIRARIGKWAETIYRFTPQPLKRR